MLYRVEHAWSAKMINVETGDHGVLPTIEARSMDKKVKVRRALKGTPTDSQL